MPEFPSSWSPPGVPAGRTLLAPDIVFKVRLVASTLLLLLVFSIAACGSNTTGVSESGFPILPTDELIEVGQPLYQQNCASCHGDATTRPPVAFAPPHTDNGHTWHHPDQNLVEWILDGVPLATAMPEFRGKLNEGEVRAIVAYIKTFWSQDNLNQQIEGSRRLEDALN